MEFSKKEIEKMFEYLASDRSKEERDTEDFIRKHMNADVENFAVIMYMVSALHYFSDKNLEQIEEVAFELAYLGMEGIRPHKKGYRVRSIPSEKFSGYKILAYYYVSWKLYAPHLIGEMELAFEREFDTALRVRKALTS